MRTQNSRLAKLLFAVAFMGLVQCGNQKSKTDGVIIRPIPEEPIIITADVTSGDGTKYTAPWFDFTLKIKNGSTQAFVIVAIIAEISIQDKNGGIATKKWAGDPGQFNRSFNDLICNYASFGVWTVDEDDYLKITNPDPGCLSDRIVNFRVDSLPLPATESYRYKVTVEPVGYFIDADELPSDRFEKSKMFYTQ